MVFAGWKLSTIMKRRVEDRRGKPRFEILGDLWGHIDITSSILVRNIGRDGALLESPLQLEPNSMHWITVIVEGEPYLVQVRVRHSRAEPRIGGELRFSAGVEFVKLPPAVADELRRSTTTTNTVSAEMQR